MLSDAVAQADLFLRIFEARPLDAMEVSLRALNEQLGPDVALFRLPAAEPAPSAPPGSRVISLRPHRAEDHQLHMIVPEAYDPADARHFLSRTAALLSRIEAISLRHAKLKDLAETDHLTGVHNARFFDHFLDGLLVKARKHHFPVTVMLFDIDDFKSYNDVYGHAAGDEILRRTAELMKRCCREHDLVARRGGDEFGVIFWDKGGPRQPHEPRSQEQAHARSLEYPRQVFERFRRMMSTQKFEPLGPQGSGRLSISAGAAVFPYDANTREELIQAADRQLMLGAKKSGKNSLFIVGSDEGRAG